MSRPGNVPARRQLRRLAGAMLAAGPLLASGCGGPPAGGDAGGKRLHELSGDRVFAAAPQGASTSVTRTPARYRKPGFTGGGWQGPSVVVTITGSAPPADVYRFYARRAAAAGWRPTASGALGLTDRWAKTYPDGAPATLSLALLTRAQAARERTYRLSGAVAPATP